MSSSMRNAVQRRVHRERGQPEERKKWGLLEKHKDYSARARDYNAKQMKLKSLREKVLDKNPDEFYFGMMSRMGPRSDKSSNGTVNGDRGNKVLSQEAVRLFKTQDLGYVRTMRNKTIKEVSKLEMEARGIVGHGQKTVFVDEPIKHPEGLTLYNVEETKEAVKEEVLVNPQKKYFSFNEQHRQKLQYQQAEKVKDRLNMAQKRLNALVEAEQALEFQRAKMAKSPTVEGVNKHGVKFKVRERKR